MIKGMHHIAINVSSYSGVDFYKALGFNEVSRTKCKREEVVSLRCGDEELEIFINKSYSPQNISSKVVPCNALSFCVNNIEAEWARLKQFNPEPIKTEEDGTKVFFIKDPDGLLIEIRE